MAPILFSINKNSMLDDLKETDFISFQNDHCTFPNIILKYSYKTEKNPDITLVHFKIFK